MNLKPTFCYRFRDSFFSILTLIGVLSAVMVLMVITAVNRGGAERMTLTAISFCSSLCLLIIGLASVREDLRMGMQFGISRGTIFAANLAAALAAALILSILGELFTATGQAAAASLPNIYFSDFYQMGFLDTDGPMTFVQHAASGLFNFTLQLLCYGMGVLLSLLYFRLNKFGITVTSIALSVLLFWSAFSAPFPSQIAAFVRWLFSGIGNWTVAALVSSVVMLALSWLLLRRAPLKPSK